MNTLRKCIFLYEKIHETVYMCTTKLFYAVNTNSKSIPVITIQNNFKIMINNFPVNIFHF